jgi:D-3-phosphoglycerate dehydrogenase / 2-oxoglutarate reductase
MKDGGYFINTSRGEVVDENALLQAIRDKNLKVALDVYQNEPLLGSCSWSTELTNNEFVIGTHHIGASTEQAQEAIGTEVINIVKTFINTGEVLNCVNYKEILNED